MKATLDDASFGQDDETSRLFMRAQNGESDAATELYEQCVPQLRGWLEHRVTPARAADVAHDTLVRAFRYGNRFRPDASFMAWARTMAWRMAMNQQRDESRRKARENAYSEQELVLPASGGPADEEIISVMQRCVCALPLEQQELVRQRFGQNQSAAEIAALTGRNRGAVAVSLHRICKRLRSSMEEQLRASRFVA